MRVGPIDKRTAISVPISFADKKRIEQEAASQGVTPQEWVRRAVVKALAGQRKEPGRTPHERFMAFVDKGTGEGTCWVWVGGLHRNGHGKFGADGRAQLAHRWSYEHHRGPIPEGLEIDHLCNNPPCVNPRHLEPVTHLENVRRAGVRSRAS